ncbi:hypothetical protein EDD22DRAFT_1047428 [Suillus occidentalis]|nr:hypothetical protein EDD22DRAFT_1047428 [Suillus occidentalis]
MHQHGMASSPQFPPHITYIMSSDHSYERSSIFATTMSTSLDPTWPSTELDCQLVLLVILPRGVVEAVSVSSSYTDSSALQGSTMSSYSKVLIFSTGAASALALIMQADVHPGRGCRYLRQFCSCCGASPTSHRSFFSPSIGTHVLSSSYPGHHYIDGL